MKRLHLDESEPLPNAFTPTNRAEEPLIRNRRSFKRRLATIDTLLQRFGGVNEVETKDIVVRTELMLGREASLVDDHPRDGGFGQPDDVERQVLHFLSTPELVRASTICRKWRELSRQSDLWEPRLLTVEGYSLRVLHSLPLPTPAIEVAVIHYRVGLADGPLLSDVDKQFGESFTDEKSKRRSSLAIADQRSPSMEEDVYMRLRTSVRSSHVVRSVSLDCICWVDPVLCTRKLCAGSVTKNARSWLDVTTPVDEGLLRCLCVQLLRALIALSEAGLCHVNMSLDNLLISSPYESAKSCPHEDEPPLLRVAGLEYVRHIQSAEEWQQRSNGNEDVMRLALLAPNEVPMTPPTVDGMIAGFGRCCLELAMRESILRWDNAAVFLLREASYPFSPRIRDMIVRTLSVHPCMQAMFEMRLPPVIVGGRSAFAPRFESLEAILGHSWLQQVQLVQPQSALGREYSELSVSEQRLKVELFRALVAPQDASERWLRLLGHHQRKTVQSLDLSKIDISCMSIILLLERMSNVVHLALPQVMLIEKNLDKFLEATGEGILPHLASATPAMIRAMRCVRKAYIEQVKMIDFLLASPQRVQCDDSGA